MATLDQEKAARSELRTYLEALDAIDISSLIRRDELGSMNFELGVPFFERTLRLYRELIKQDLETVPFTPLTQLRDRAREALGTYNDIKDFSFARFPNQTQGQRDSLINTIRDRYDTEFSQITPIIAYGIRRGTDFDRLEREAKSTVASMGTLLEEQKRTKEETALAVQKTLDDVRKLAREAGVSQHAEVFREEATAHDHAATQWLKATVWIAAFTSLVAFAILGLSWFFTPSDLTGAKAIQIGIAKLAILSLLFSAVIWVGRIYRSHRHNCVVNRHRLNALRTFETFARAASDDSTKNAVLIQATQCIFTPQQTGYITGEPETNPASQILEVVRSVGKSGSP